MLSFTSLTVRSQETRHQIWIFAAATILFFVGLGSTHLWDKDETLYGSCAREMFQRGDWVVPTFNDNLFPDKPPLMYWLMMSGFEMFGVNEFATRFWSAVLGVATALLTYHIGRMLFRPQVGFWAGIAVASNVIFTVSARAATVDSALTFCATLGMFALVAGMKETFGEQQSPSAHCTPRWPGLAVLYATMALGFLAKGPVGLVLPLAVAGLFLLILSALRSAQSTDGGSNFRKPSNWIQVFSLGNFLRTTWNMRPITAAIIVLAIAAPWYVLVGLQTDGQWLRKFFIEQNLERALRPFDNHRGLPFYYVVAIFVGFFPWSVFLPGAVIQMLRGLRDRDTHANSNLLLACWLGVYVVFWSLVSTKLPHYVLPAYPAIAVITAAFVDRRIANRPAMSRLWTRYAVASLLVAGVGFAVSLPIVAHYFVPGEALLGLLGIIPLAAGVWCWVWFERRRPQLALHGFAVTSIALLLAIFTVGAQRVDRHQTAPQVLSALRERGDDTRNLVAYRFMRESYVFYAGHSIRFCRDQDELEALLADQPQLRVLTTSDALKSLDIVYPGRFDTVTCTPRFLEQGDVVVLAQASVPESEDHELADGSQIELHATSYESHISERSI